MRWWFLVRIAILLSTSCLFADSNGSLLLRGTVARIHAVRIVVCSPGRFPDPVAIVSGWPNAGAAVSITLSSSNPDSAGYTIVQRSAEGSFAGGGSWIAAAACAGPGEPPCDTLMVSIAAR